LIESAATCPNCRQAVAPDARFCPSCGARLDADPADPGSISYSQPEPKLFGVLLPTPTFILACVVLGGALAAFISGSPVLGVMLLAFSAALFVLFYGAAERNPESGVARAAVDAVGRVSGWLRFSRESASAWSGAGARVVKLKQELRPLRAERRNVQLALGGAAYEQDEGKIASLRARIAEIDDEIAARERESAEAVARARHRVDDERVAVQPTEHLAPAEPVAVDEAETAEAAQPVEEEDEQTRKAG
jgi:Double zinc ribbon